MASSSELIDLSEVVKKWAKSAYKDIENKKQKILRQKEEREKGKLIDVMIDWSALEFHDETKWEGLVDDTSDDGTDGSGGAATSDVTTKKQPCGAMKAVILFETKFTNNTTDPQEYTIRTEKTTRSSMVTTIDRGLKLGSEVGVKVTLPGDILELNAGFRDEFLLKNSKGDTFEEQLTWSLESKIVVQPQHEADARLLVNEKKQSGDFTIKSRVSGNVRVTFTSIKDNNSFIMSTSEDIVTILKVNYFQNKYDNILLSFKAFIIKYIILH